eukprot:COSAG02_NODE_57_length_43668_cov_118.217196_5_plen_118_part_00
MQTGQIKKRYDASPVFAELLLFNKESASTLCPVSECVEGWGGRGHNLGAFGLQRPATYTIEYMYLRIFSRSVLRDLSSYCSGCRRAIICKIDPSVCDNRCEAFRPVVIQIRTQSELH